MGLLVLTAEMAGSRCQPTESIVRRELGTNSSPEGSVCYADSGPKWDILMNVAVIFIVWCRIEYASQKLAFMQTTMTYMFNLDLHFLFYKPF